MFLREASLGTRAAGLNRVEAMWRSGDVADREGGAEAWGIVVMKDGPFAKEELFLVVSQCLSTFSCALRIVSKSVELLGSNCAWCLLAGSAAPGLLELL